MNRRSFIAGLLAVPLALKPASLIGKTITLKVTGTMRNASTPLYARMARGLPYLVNQDTGTFQSLRRDTYADLKSNVIDD